MPEITCSDEQFIKCLLKCVGENCAKNARFFYKQREKCQTALLNHYTGVKKIKKLNSFMNEKELLLSDLFKILKQNVELFHAIERKDFKTASNLYPCEANMLDKETTEVVVKRIKKLAEKYS